MVQCWSPGVFWKALIRYGLASVFLLSGVGKLVDPAGGVGLVTLVSEAFGVVGFVYGKQVVYLVAAVEMFIVLLLLIEPYARAGLIMFCGLMALFTFGLTILAISGIDVPDCGCFGPFIPGGSLKLALLRNIAILLFSCCGYVMLYLPRRVM